LDQNYRKSRALSTRFGGDWEEGRTIYEAFGASDQSNPAVAAHLRALAGSESDQRLDGKFADMLLRVVPLKDENGDVSGCLSVLRYVANEEDSDNSAVTDTSASEPQAGG
jgi:hypothetical protein